MDSLMAVELRNALASYSSERTSPQLCCSITRRWMTLTEFLSRHVLGLEESPDMPARPRLPVSAGLDVLDQIENLDDEEIERLLKERETEKL